MQQVIFQWKGSPDTVSGEATFTLIDGEIKKPLTIKLEKFSDGFELHQMMEELQKNSIKEGMETISYMVKNTLNTVVGKL